MGNKHVTKALSILEEGFKLYRDKIKIGMAMQSVTHIIVAAEDAVVELRKGKMLKKRRNRFEMWLDKYNHTLELVRTLNIIVSVLILLKVFGII
jgi:hypothetical protein